MFHSAIFMFFSLILIATTTITLMRDDKNVEYLLDLVFCICIDLGDLALVWILYTLGTKQYAVSNSCERQYSEPSTPNRFTVNDIYMEEDY